MINSLYDYHQVFKSSITRIYDIYDNVVGAGFLVSNQYVLTCAHVITAALNIPEDTKEIPTQLITLDFPLIGNGEKLKAQVVFWKPVSSTEKIEDIAGLKLNGNLPNMAQPVQLVEAENVKDHPVEIFGFPQGHNDGVWASGVLIDKNAKGWLQMVDVKVTGYQVEPGFSGAPVWDKNLAGVVGIAIAAEKRRENVKAAFLIPTEILRQAWTKLDVMVINAPQSINTSPESFRQVQKRTLQKNLKVLLEKYEKAYNQLNYIIAEADKVSIKLQIENIEIEIINIENKIEELRLDK